MTPLRTLFAPIVAVFLACSTLAAQEPDSGTRQGTQPPGQLIDRVVAVVGDSIVLRSEIDEQMLRLAARGRPLPEDPRARERLRQRILQRRIRDLLLVQAAREDSVRVPAERVRTLVEQDLARRRRAFSGQAGFERALRRQGLTMAEYRNMLTRQYRRNALIQRYLRQQRRKRQPPVTQEELREFFESHKDQLGERPATITFRQVIVAPQPSDSARAAAKALAEKVRAKLRKGADFATLARKYSDDPGTAERGGLLGWFRRGEMVAKFENAAFALRPGQISPVIETSFGYHIIKLEKIRGRERKARHILIQPEMTDADLARAKRIAQSVARKARSGTDFDALIERYGDPNERSRIGPYPRAELPARYTSELAGVEAADTVIGPFRLPGPSGPDKWAVVKVTEVLEAGEYTLADVRAQVRKQVQRRKMVDELLAELRQRTYIDVRL